MGRSKSLLTAALKGRLSNVTIIQHHSAEKALLNIVINFKGKELILNREHLSLFQ